MKGKKRSTRRKFRVPVPGPGFALPFALPVHGFRAWFWSVFVMLLTVFGLFVVLEQQKAIEDLGVAEDEQRSGCLHCQSVMSQTWRSQAESLLEERSSSVMQYLRAEGFQRFAVYSRVKSNESALAKAKRHGIDVSQLRDIFGIRVVVPNELDVYSAMAKLSQRFGVLSGSMKNYIAQPKPSGYQSLHFSSQIDGLTIEFQLRTKAMHEASEAEHEAYKLRMRAA